MNKLFPPLKIEIFRKNVLHLLGYRRKNAFPPPEVESQLNRELTLGAELLRFKGIYRKFAAVHREGKVALDNGYVIPSAKFAHWVQGCPFVYLFAVTAGPLFAERTAQLLDREQISAAMIADAVGSAAAEACAETASKFIAELEPGSRLTKRYSPGYGDWDVADNRNFLTHIDAGQIGVTLSPGGLMIPEKSISAAIGVHEPNQ